jgi:hypothetical protein
MFTFIWQYRSRFQSNATNVVLLGVWRSLVAHFLREEEVGGSNPLTPTMKCYQMQDRWRSAQQQGRPPYPIVAMLLPTTFSGHLARH